MQVNLYATFRLIAGVRNLELDLPTGTTVRQAVDEILTRLPDLRPHWVNAQNEIHAHVHGFVNEKDVSTLPQGWDTPLQSGDVLDFFPPVAGG
ncbi:MAG: ubiquitin-like small modifier protein 1 [Chloroflexota bacterium]